MCTCKKSLGVLGFVLLIFARAPLWAQGTLEDYKRAERFLQWNVAKLVSKLQVNPHWIAQSERFWYKNELRQGKEFILVDPVRKMKRTAFDHVRLARSLSRLTGKRYQAKTLPFESFKFVRNRKAIAFDIDQASWTCDLTSYKCARSRKRGADSHELLSPDGRWIAFVKDFNLYVRSATTGEQRRLSRDGEELYDYGRRWFDPRIAVREDEKPKKTPISAIWSPDSKKIFTCRIDARKTKMTHLLQSAPPGGAMRAALHSYPYPLPGDVEIPLAEPVIFDVENQRQIPVATEPLLQPLMSWLHPWGFWSKDSRKVYFVHTERGYKTAHLFEADVTSGKARRIFDERSSTLVDHNLQNLRIVNNGAEIIWSSERDGWNHLYLYDGKTGGLKNRITKGEWVVRGIEHVDEKRRQIYFTAGGREAGRDPYLRHLYRVRMDGTGLELLTPEDADHDVRFSPSGRFFVDTFSTVNTIPVSVARRSSDGRIVLELEKADLELLLATGWKWPEPFRVKARDGKTDIYGVIFRPANLDPTKRYPVIDNIYSGPHGIYAPKSFPRSARSFYQVFVSQSVAEVGFVVVMIDGLGQNFRGKAFRDVQHQNLADAGLKDHIAAIKALAKRYPYMDLSRVGIFGFSAGGYASARAILAYPEFYKAAVSSAGNHDHRMDKLSWNERWMGFPVDDHYREQSNVTLAHKLKGKLLLTYGDLDTNVPPASTIRLVHALIEANKDFELLVFPNRGHYLDDDPYFIRKRWDFFVRHLLNVEPPKEYNLQKPE